MSVTGNNPGETMYNNEMAPTPRISQKKITSDREMKVKPLRPKVKMESMTYRLAEDKKELEQGFSLVYDSYQKKGFVPKEKPHGMLFSIYSLLPGTLHAMTRTSQGITSNLTAIPCSQQFGLPMDTIYKPELDRLRARGRKIVELSALATSKTHRCKNVFQYQIQALYWHCFYRGVNDICVTINPRHKDYYMCLFPFQELGPARYYPQVNAPAVALRCIVSKAQERMREISASIKLEKPLYRFFFDLFHGKNRNNEIRLGSGDFQLLLLSNRLTNNNFEYFLGLEPGIIQDLTNAQIHALQKIYPKVSMVQ